MKYEFEPTGKIGRHFYQIIGRARFFDHPDGRPASEVESTAMAQGYIPSKLREVEEIVGRIEAHRDGKNVIWKAVCKWIASAKAYEYGAGAVWQEYSIRRG